MKVRADARRKSTPDGQDFLTDGHIIQVIFKLLLFYKEVLDDGSTKEKSIKGKKR